MTLLHIVGRVSTWFEVLFDATALVLLMIPALYFFLFRPLTQKMQAQARAEEVLRETNKALLREVLERRQTEEKLAAERKNLLGILDAMEDGAYIIDRDHNILYVNTSFIRRLGSVAGRKCFTYFHERSEACPWCPNARVFAGETVKWQFHHQKTDRVYDLLDTPIRMADGSLAKLEFIHDITEHLRAQEALRESELRYRALMEQAGEAILVLDRTATIREINPKVCEISGFEPEELLERPLTEFISQENLEAVPNRLSQVLSGQELHGERQMVRKDGSLVPVEFSAKLLRDGRILAIARDITVRKHEAEELRRSREDLRNLSAHLESARETERQRIARELHDELGQALTALKMNLGWLAAEHPQAAEVLAKMGALIDTTVLQTQRICRELRPPILDDLGLASAIEWQAREFEERTGIAARVRIDVADADIGGDLPITIFRILQEALTNVARHAQAGAVDIALRAGDQEIKLVVSDDGCGIPLEKIADQSSLGLLGIRERVRGLKGSMEIQGEPGRGTRLAIRIPLPAEEEA